jgi:sulfhydrogenase subunit beta (sulfur reductase)
MRIVKLKKENLNVFLEAVSAGGELWAPVKKGPKHAFAPIQDLGQIELVTTRTILPPKKLMVPPSFTMFTMRGNEYRETLTHVKRRILFGIHPCDIHGLLTLDKLFMQNFPDPYYIEARKATLILGLSCRPDEHCLAKWTATHVAEEGFDLFFNDLGSVFLVFIGSSKGDDIVRLKPDLFDEKVSDDDIQAYVKWQKERDAAYRPGFDFVTMPRLMELKYKDPFWEKAGKACLACGGCSMVCPTCNCYNVADRKIPGEKPGERVRQWDACTLHDYSLVAGGENFREHKRSRLKLYYTHKLEAYMSKFGKPSCVGCGRCVVTCPVGISVKSIADALEGRPVDAFWNTSSMEARV